MPSFCASACWDRPWSMRRRRTVRPISGRAILQTLQLYGPGCKCLHSKSPNPCNTRFLLHLRRTICVADQTHSKADEDALTMSTPKAAYAPEGMGSAPGHDPERFAGIVRDYTPADVDKLSGSFRIKHTLADMGARRLWHLL